jgi:anti-sigma B factor antagonist
LAQSLASRASSETLEAWIITRASFEENGDLMKFFSLRTRTPSQSLATLAWAILCQNRCMALEYFDWEVGDVIVLHLQGPITLGEGTRKLRALIQEKLQAGKKNIVLNLAEVYYIDSSGLGELVAAYTTTNRNGGKLKLMKLSPRVKDLAQLTKVYQIFEVFNDEDSAVRSFGA